MFLSGSDVAASIICLLLLVSAMTLRLNHYKRMLVRSALLGTAEKLHDGFYYIVPEHKFSDLVTAGWLRPENLNQYHADAAVAWLEKCGVKFCPAGTDVKHTPSSLELVRTVVKAVIDANTAGDVRGLR